VRAGAALAAAVAALVLAAAGCGGDDEQSTSGAGSTETSGARTTPADTAGSRSTRSDTTPATEGGGKSPEKQRGGAGDEVPNAVQALVTGRRGKLSPSAIRVPAFIAIRLELRSADGLDYSLSGGGKSLHAGEGENSATATFDGLHRGRKLVLNGTGGRVVISANAQPGP
jgi:hypothetical protein